MMRLLLAITVLGALYGQEEIQGPPLWAIQGIAWVETRSYWDVDGKFHYADRRIGSAHEYGPFQCRYSAFVIVARAGERFEDLRRDPAYACEIAGRLLVYLYGKTGSWAMAVRGYNCGLSAAKGRSGDQYLQAVKLAGLQRLYSQGEIQ